jgi:hypothetical protein
MMEFWSAEMAKRKKPEIKSICQKNICLEKERRQKDVGQKNFVRCHQSNSHLIEFDNHVWLLGCFPSFCHSAGIFLSAGVGAQF